MKRLATLLSVFSLIAVGCGSQTVTTPDTQKTNTVQTTRPVVNWTKRFEQVKNGMTREQVLSIMSTPTLSAESVDNWYTADGYHFKVSYDPSQLVYSATAERDVTK